MTDVETMRILEELLCSRWALKYRTVLPVLGIPVTFEADGAEIVAVAEEAFGDWCALEATPELIEPHGPTIRFAVREGSGGGEPHAPLSYDLPKRGQLRITSSGSEAVADSERNSAAAVVTTAFLADRSHFRYGVLEALTLFLLSRRDRQPLHAAALVREGRALLLAGPSGVGKSTLAYAGLRTGLQVLAEDVVYLQSRPELRVWGAPGFLHLPLDARRHFPELARRKLTLRANGKVKVAIDVRELAGVPPLPVVEHAGVCLLRRGASRASLDRLTIREVERALVNDVEPGFDVFAETIAPVVGRFVRSASAWRLELGRHPQEAVSLLVRALDGLTVHEHH